MTNSAAYECAVKGRQEFRAAYRREREARIRLVAAIRALVAAIGNHSIAISLKRIVDALSAPDAYGLTGGAALANAILRGLRDGR